MHVLFSNLRATILILVISAFTVYLLHYSVAVLIAKYSVFALSPFSVYLLPELFFIVVLHFGILIFYARKRITNNLMDSNILLKKVVLGCVFFLLCLLVIMFNCLVPTNNTFFCMNLFRENSFTEFLQIFTVSCTIVILFFIYNSTIHSSVLKIDHIILILYVLLGGLFLLSAVDFLTFYLALEIFSIPSYILVASSAKSNFSTEAGLKYFVIGSFSSGVMLFGLSLIYGATGCSTFPDAANLMNILSTSMTIDFPTNKFYAVGVFFFLCGFLLKMGVPPFHLWVLDVYTGAPTIITIFLLTVPKIVTWGVLYNLLFEFYFINVPGINSLLIFCVFSCFICGYLPGLFQFKIKRLFIYSSLGTNGLFLLSILGASSTGFVYYLVFYILGLISFFSGALLLRDAYSKHLQPKLVDFADLHKQNPIFAYALAASLFSLGGVPPFIGFFTKYFTVSTIISENGFITLISLLLAVLSIFYYLRIIKWTFFSIYGESATRSSIAIEVTNSFLTFFFLLSNSLFILSLFIQPELFALLHF